MREDRLSWKARFAHQFLETSFFTLFSCSLQEQVHFQVRGHLLRGHPRQKQGQPHPSRQYPWMLFPRHRHVGRSRWKERCRCHIQAVLPWPRHLDQRKQHLRLWRTKRVGRPTFVSFPHRDYWVVGGFHRKKHLPDLPKYRTTTVPCNWHVSRLTLLLQQQNTPNLLLWRPRPHWHLQTQVAGPLVTVPCITERTTDWD